MIQLRVPVCCGVCGKHEAALYDSIDWPGLVICRGCVQRVAVWLLKRDLADENPFAEALLSEDSSGDSYPVTHPTLAGPVNSFSETRIKRVR